MRTDLPVSARHNRISAFLVALLYVFFSTFGAVAHTHAPVEFDRKAPVSIGADSSASNVARCSITSPRDCAACEWQALSVTQVSASQAHVDSALLRMVPAMPSFSVHAVCLARFSSRAPPTA